MWDDDSEDSLTRSGNVLTERRLSLRLKRKVALPEGGARLGLGKDKVFLDSRAESDGEQESSTEELTQLSDANNRMRAKTTDDIDDSSDEDFIDPSSIDSTELEHICAAILPTALHHPSTETESYSQYIKQVLGLPDDKFDALFENAEQNENTELHLVCNVKSAQNLLPKDSKSVPDVVCHLAIFPSSKQMDPSVFSANILNWLEKGVIKSMKRTTFASSTLSPLWNQSFQLSLSDPSHEMIVAEVWGKRNKAPQSKKPKEYYDKADNFIGRAFYLLKSTPIDGESRTLSLYSHSGKHERGTIDLHLTIKGQQEDIPVNVSIREHTLLLKLIINREAKTGSGYVKCWDGKLGEKAEIILLKHVELSGISTLQEKSIRFHVFMEYYEAHKVKMFVLSELLTDIISSDASIVDDHKDQIWVKQLLFDMQTLHSIVLKQLNNHLTEYNLKGASDLREITCMIKILKLLFSYSPFLNKLKKKDRDLQGSVEISIQAAVPNWFLELSRSMLKTRTTCTVSGAVANAEIMSLKGLCHHCLKHAHRAAKSLNPIFESIDVDYFTTFYVVLDKLLAGDVMPRLQELVGSSEDQELYEVYVVFKDLSKLAAQVNASKKEALNIAKFHTYFKGNAVNWIDLGTYKCKERIQQAIQLDESMNLDLDQPRFSSSAVDTSGFLLQLGNFWKNLEWPIATDAIGYLCTIIEQISQMSLYYVESLYHSLLRDSSAMYDSSGRFQSSEKLCTILNNMYHVKQTLADMPVTLELDKYYDWLESECSQLGSKAKKLVNSLLMSHDEDIENKISYFVDRITERLTPDIIHFFELIVPANPHGSLTKKGRLTNDNRFSGIRLPWQKELPDALSNEDAIAPLLDFLASNLQILGDYLLTPVLQGILHKLWNVLIGVVQGRIAVISRHSSVIYLYERLHFFMTALKNFFHADGNGMALQNLETEPYKFIIEKLNLLQTPSKDLILRFLAELEEQQKYIEIGSSTRQGTLQLSVGYLKEKEVLEVSVIQAKGLPGKGSLCTFAEVVLLPEWLFTKSAKKVHKTPVIRGSVDPFYGEEFRLPAKESHMSELGAMLVVFVIDEESSTVLGMNVLSGLMMPRLSEKEALSSNAPQRQNSARTLFTPRDAICLKEIEARLEAHDADIMDFCKENPRLFQKKKRIPSRFLSRDKSNF